MTAKNAWVISVKYGTGCYRHLEVPKERTLAELADDILWAFDFVNDHAHAFFMDNIAWSEGDAYYASYVDLEDEERHTEDTDLTVLSLGQSFKFVFDFGDDWRFQCKVLRETLSEEKETMMVRCVGESPEQYGDWDWEE
ncbi:hypothetical protein ABID29_001978 [Streptococcus rupicaprae]|uniref:Plasmid pRiA4b Orf3-like domain-containing protein n=1 Tax=Streptococcus rupicaprae TaxID=759619 RepID=A0ABV2FJT9_9STRE